MGIFEPFVTRPYRGSEDLEGMAAVANASALAQGSEDTVTVASMAQQYEHLARCDPEKDILVVEREGQIVGYARTAWEDVAEGYRSYWIVAAGDPRFPDLEADLYEWAEDRARQNAANHPSGEKRIEAFADETTEKAAMLRRRGYTTVRYAATLVRPRLTDIPDRRLPPGVEVRPVLESDLRQIWEADIEAFRDHRGYVEQTENDWEAWLDDANWDPTLWQVAWSRDSVVGQVRSFIDDAENALFGRLRGWTEDISTAREWRGQGIAGALICSSLRLLAARGMTEAALGVDTENPTGAQSLYLGLGYERRLLYGEYSQLIESG